MSGCIGRGFGCESTHRFSRLASIGRPPSLAGDNCTLMIPCCTPVCCSPETSMTSNVKSSHGIRGKVMLRCISIFSPNGTSQYGILRLFYAAVAAAAAGPYLFPCLRSAPDAPRRAGSRAILPKPDKRQSAMKRWSRSPLKSSGFGRPRPSW